MSRRDDAEFEEFVAARLPQLRRVAFLIIRDWHLAEDAVQMSLIKVYRAWPRVRKGALEAYTRRAVVNTSISMARRPRRELVTDAPLETAGLHEVYAIDGDLVAALRQLSPGQAAVVALRFLDDLSVSEVASVLGVSEGTVKSQAHRGLQHLKGLVPDPSAAEEGR